MAPTQLSSAVVLVPGAHHTVEHVQQVTNLVKKDGYTIEVVRPLQPGDGISPGGLEGNLKQIRDVVKKQIDHGHDVLLVVHSASGATGPAAIEGLTKKDDTPGVKHILAIAGILTAPGESIADVLQGRTAIWQGPGDGGITVFPYDHPGEAPTKPGRVELSPVTALYNDMTEAQKRQAYDLLIPIYVDSFSAKMPYSAWQHIPMTYVIPDKDLALFPEVQQDLLDRTGVKIDVRHWDSSHTPFVSIPDKVVALIEELVDAPAKL